MGELPAAVADPLGFLIGSRCDADTAPAYGSRGELPPVNVGELLRDSARLDCEQRPAVAPDAVRWVESTMSPLVYGLGGGLPPAAVPLAPGQSLVAELARLFVPAAALGVVETIASYVAVEVTDDDGQLVRTIYAETQREPGYQSTSIAAELNARVSDPFGPPLGTGLRAPGLFGAAPPPVTWRVRLSVRTVGVASREPGNARARIVGPVGAVPSGADLCGPWDDNRRPWGSRYSERHRYLVDGPQLVHLLAELRAPSALPDGVARSTITLGGRLAGWTQAAGWTGRALDTATART